MLANGGWDSTLTLLTWTIWRTPTNASKWRMGFNSLFKGLMMERETVSETLGMFSTTSREGFLDYLTVKASKLIAYRLFYVIPGNF